MVSQEDVDKWKAKLSNIQSNDPWVKNYYDYVNELEGLQIPVIFDLPNLAQILDIDISIVSHFCGKPHEFYRTFDIPKRSGGTRTIESPLPELLEAQRWIKAEILEKLYISDAAHGFTKNKTIITNASEHLGNPQILKMDVKEFFPSIRQHRVIGLFKALGYSWKVSVLLSQICCSRGRLPQGAATSPTLSNILFYGADCRLKALAQNLDINYTRYADDLTFSGQHISGNLDKTVSRILKECDFFPNEKKTRFLREKNQKKIITGISIGSGQLRIPRASKRRIRSEIHNALHDKVGMSERLAQDPYFYDRLLGKIQFWLRVEPQCQYIKMANKKVLQFLHIAST